MKIAFVLDRYLNILLIILNISFNNMYVSNIQVKKYNYKAKIKRCLQIVDNLCFIR